MSKDNKEKALDLNHRREQDISRGIAELEELWERLCEATNYERMDLLLQRLHRTMNSRAKRTLSAYKHYK